MDIDKKCCSFFGISSLKKSQILGLILILLALLLTFYRPDGLGILGMFLAGICLFKGNCGCKCCCHQSCEEKCHVNHECSDLKVEKKSKSKVKEK